MSKRARGDSVRRWESVLYPSLLRSGQLPFSWMRLCWWYGWLFSLFCVCTARQAGTRQSAWFGVRSSLNGGLCLQYWVSLRFLSSLWFISCYLTEHLHETSKLRQSDGEDGPRHRTVTIHLFYAQCAARQHTQQAPDATNVVIYRGAHFRHLLGGAFVPISPST